MGHGVEEILSRKKIAGDATNHKEQRERERDSVYCLKYVGHSASN